MIQGRGFSQNTASQIRNAIAIAALASCSPTGDTDTSRSPLANGDISLERISLSPSAAAAGSSISVELNLRSTVDAVGHVQLILWDRDWQRLTLVENGTATNEKTTVNVEFRKGATATFRWSARLPAGASSGSHVLMASVFDADWSGKVLEHLEFDALEITSSSENSGHVPPGYSQTFADEFDELSLDVDASASGRWAPFFPGWGVRHLEGNADEALKASADYAGSGGASLGLALHEVDGGSLSLFGREIPSARRSQFFNFPYAAGMISGELSHAQLYGYWETRLRIKNVSKGHHWAVWLLADDKSWPPEVDILEVVGLDPSQFHLNFHYAGPNGEHLDTSSTVDVKRAPDDWYVFGFEWTETSMKWFIDGALVKTEPNRETERPFYFLVSPEIGGNWPGDPDGSTVWPMEMEIDYVRIYAK